MGEGKVDVREERAMKGKKEDHLSDSEREVQACCMFVCGVDQASCKNPLLCDRPE